MTFAASYSLVEVAIAVVIIAAVCGLVWVALRQFQIAIPQWAIQVFWIVVVAAVVIFAIRFLTTL
jgi:hypothetical protein